MTAKFGRRVHVSVPTDRKPPNWFLATAPNLLHRAVKVTRAVFLTSDDGQRTTGLRDGRIQNTPAASTITKFQVGISSLEHRTEQQKKKINFTVEIRFFFFFFWGVRLFVYLAAASRVRKIGRRLFHIYLHNWWREIEISN